MGDHSDNGAGGGKARLSRYFISRFIVILIMLVCVYAWRLSSVQFSIFPCDLRGRE